VLLRKKHYQKPTDQSHLVEHLCFKFESHFVLLAHLKHRSWCQFTYY